MAENGALHSAHSDIENIRSMLLQGQNQKTSLIFILKEIVQNADDCRSQRLSIGLSKGLNKAEHPLLRSPAILVVNDGHFSKKDNKSIRSIGASAKENDSSAVGKFGIGIKTVFFICEAFFYLKGPTNTDAEVASGSMLNLWATDDPDDVPKSDWDDLNFEISDQTLMADEREKMGFQDGFTLWLPLRKKEHCQRGQGANPIVEQYPGDDSQFINKFRNILRELAELVPLLKHLKTIEIYYEKIKNCIQLDSGSSQCLTKFDIVTPQPEFLKGNIQIDDEKQQYFGYQQVLDRVELKNLKDNESWPKLIPNAKGFREKQKAEQHCATVILVRPKNDSKKQGKLLIRWAVFLPTAESPTGKNFEEIALEGNEDYILTLHGFFFLGADRRRIFNWSTSSNNTVLQEWNKILAEQGTLPLLLPTLEDFAQKKSPEIVKELTQKLQKSELWKNYKEFICSKGSWAYVVHFKDDVAESKWTFIERKTTIYQIPESENLFEVLPGLKSFSRNNILTYKNWPFLSQQKTTDIPSSKITELLQYSYSIAHKICTHQEQVKTLYDFLQTFKLDNLDNELKREIQRFVKQALIQNHLDNLAPNFSDLLGMITPEQVLYLPKDCPPNLCIALIKLQEKTSCLIVPASLNHNNYQGKSRQLSVNDARIILKKLSEFAKNSIAFTEAYALKVIDWSGNKSFLIQQIQTLPLFKLQILGKENKPQLTTLDQLQIYLNQKRLFSNKSQQFVKILSQAIEWEIYVAEPLIGKYLDISQDLPICDANNAIALLNLNQKPPLNPVSERKKLLIELLKSLDSGETNKQAIRYLLHEESKQFDSKDTLYAGDSNSSNLYYRVLRHLIGKEQGWRFISSELLNLLSPQQRNWLIIADVNKSSIEQELHKNYNVSSIDWSSFETTDREDLITNLQESLVKKLRIHETIDSSQKLVSIDEHTYLEGGFEINPKLVQELGIVLIRRSQRGDFAYHQENLSPPITAKILVEKYLLRCSNPSQYWQVIMDCLEDDPDICSQVDGLSKTVWLPSVSGIAYKPDDIIHLEKIPYDIQQIAANCDRIYITSQELSSGLINHSGFEKILCKRLFPKRKNALEMLGFLLEESQQYYVGDFENEIDDQVLEDWLTVFRKLSEEIMPIANLLNNFDRKDALIIFNKLRKQICKEKLVKILNAIADQHERSTEERIGDIKKSLWKTFCLYLQQAVKHHQWLEILNNIRLLSQANKWQQPDQLCYESSNILSSHLLHCELKKFIPNNTSNPLQFRDDHHLNSNQIELNDTTLHQDNQNSYKTLKSYFEKWPFVTRKSIGVLLRILSHDKQTEIRKLAEEHLPNAEEYLRFLKLEPTGSLITKTNKTHFDIYLNTEKIIEVLSMTNKLFKVELSKNLTSLISGTPNFQENRVKLTIQPISTNDSFELIELTKKTFQEILENIYKYNKICNLDDFWKKLNIGQDIRIAQSQILDEGTINLRNQLRSCQDNNTKIRELFQEYSKLKKPKTDLEEVDPTSSKVKEFSEKMKNIRKEIAQIIIDNEDKTQDIFLSSVKQYIENASYDSKSIPFELFQNADDACLELYKMEKDTVLDEFVLGFSDTNLWICHWGRGINKYQENDSNKLSYENDIVKMIQLHFSDKTDGVTGKFGLGFKSTFLLSEKPRIVSGSIGFEVVGGIYPRELTKEEFESTKSYLEKDTENGTVILLPDVCNADAEQVVKEFISCVPLLGAFSKWIKRFALPNNEIWVWDEQSIEGINNAYYGSSKNGEISLKGLLLGEREKRCFLKISPRGVESLSSDYSTFWVTAPTRMKLDVGFAVNAPFHLDVGRSQLDLRAGGKIKNQEIAKRLGDQLGKALIELYNLSEEELRDHLYLTADTTPLVFWTSVWNVLGVQFAQKNWEDEGIRLLYQMLWGENGGMTQLFQDCDTLPTGLPNIFEAFNGLTRPEKIHWYVKGILDKNSSVLQKVLKWPWCNKIEKSQLVSSEVAKTLEKLTGKQIESLELVTLLKWELRNTEYKLNPERSILIGNLIRQDFLKELDEPEKSQIIEELIKVKFQAKDEKWYLASQLLVAENNSDESLIVKFAPLSAILDESYQSTALSLLYLCRQDKIIDVSELVKWIRQTEGEKRDNALRYLIIGKHRDKIIECLKSQIPDWIAEIEHPTRQEQLTDRGFKKYQLQNLLNQLDLLHDQYSQQEDVEENTSQITSSNSNGKQPPKSPRKTPEQLLRQIFDWWQDNRDDLITKYERSIYPNSDWKLTKTNHNLQRSSTTKAWLALLLLGTCHTMGRTNPEQHRDFLNHCERWGWFTAIETRKIKASDWLELLDDYFSSIETGERLEYYQWVKHYPAVYAFARWWEIYRDSLLFTNQDSKNCDINIIFSPRKNNRFLQGSGQGNDAPPLGKILGIGQTFVVRELLRAEIVTNSAMHPYAYVPVRRVRGILQAIGCKGIQEGGEDRNIANSKRIYDFLVEHLGEEDAAFFGDYDLPFLMLDKEPDDQKRKILGDVPIISEEPLEDDVEGKFPSQDGNFVTLRDGRVIPRSYMN
jgi:hypothetical protein